MNTQDSHDNSASASPRYWAIIPAAGLGRRMGGQQPKQYLRIGERTVLEWTLERLASLKGLSGILVVLHPDDKVWGGLDPRLPLIDTVTGGRERGDSVLAGLRRLRGRAAPNDWVLVHDAVRPCVTGQDMEKLVEELRDDPVGGILASPVRETLKRAGPGRRIEETVDRGGLWLAATPQMFRYAVLAEAMEKTAAGGLAVTDEAAAVEALGLAVRLVEGRADNIKITHPGDLELAGLLLSRMNVD